MAQAEVLAEAVAAFEADFKEALRQAGTLQGEVAAFFGYVGGGGGGAAGGGGGPGDDAGRVPPAASLSLSRANDL